MQNRLPHRWLLTLVIVFATSACSGTSQISNVSEPDFPAVRPPIFCEAAMKLQNRLENKCHMSKTLAKLQEKASRLSEVERAELVLSRIESLGSYALVVQLLRR